MGLPSLGLPLLGGLALTIGVLSACGSAQISTRMVDDPAGEAVEYGSPTKTDFVAELDAGREYGTVTVYKKSTCDVIPVTVMQTYKETLRGDEVIERSPVSKKQVAGRPQGTVPCDQTYARNVEVLFEAAGGRFSLGTTDDHGRVAANLSKVFKVGSFDEVPAQAKILLRPENAQPTIVAGELSLAQLMKHEERVKQLISQLEEIFARVGGDAPAEDILRSYEIYNQLVDVAPEDPRVQAASARFWELLDQRKRDESIENLGKNLDALKKAQGLLQVMGDAAIPLYVQAAVSSGTLDRRALEWSSLRLVRALRSSPAVCTGGFSWTGLPSYGWTDDANLAAHYVHYGYGSPHAQVVQRACRAF
jgi:hypothetical protein